MPPLLSFLLFYPLFECEVSRFANLGEVKEKGVGGALLCEVTAPQSFFVILIAGSIESRFCCQRRGGGYEKRHRQAIEN